MDPDPFDHPDALRQFRTVFGAAYRDGWSGKFGSRFSRLGRARIKLTMIRLVLQIVWRIRWLSAPRFSSNSRAAFTAFQNWPSEIARQSTLRLVLQGGLMRLAFIPIERHWLVTACF